LEATYSLKSDIDALTGHVIGPAMPSAHRILLSSSPDPAPSSVSQTSSSGQRRGRRGGDRPCTVGGTTILDVVGGGQRRGRLQYDFML
jgi:hypothetical protein